MKTESIQRGKYIGLLLDPDRTGGDTLTEALEIATESGTDYIFTGGSISFRNIDELIDEIKKSCIIPVVLFPGNLLQLSLKADVILLLSLISGRNAELLIGNHVTAAPYLRNSKEKVIPTGYILISCGRRTSVEYVSQTEGIPSDKTDLAVATALAGEMLGLKLIYLEAGSGAEYHVPLSLISAVRKNITVPLIVGGGIRTEKEVDDVFNAGADMIVLGNGCEENPDLLRKACAVRDRLRKTQHPLA
ncbi:MAG TPA: geranylgeranylglyceryl/heptaprenylglyceryl phosphate synthase [Bacteroidales bacterium]|jgi:putative glycerol-1-phosphate prenyltransferase|nr:geranylgeranylglyceryl/heptaprenylglyceryl phosphate synthase [Bacteroidales bacterium]